MAEEYFLLDRSIINRPWYSDKIVTDIYYYCLFNASFEDKIYQGILIPKGSTIISLRGLANRLSISVQQVRTALNKLLATHDITQTTYPKFSVVATITSYPVSENNTVNNTLDFSEQHNSNTVNNTPNNTVNNTPNNTVNNTVKPAWLSEKQEPSNTLNNTVNNTLNSTVSNTVNNTIATHRRGFEGSIKEKGEREEKEKGEERETEKRGLEEEKERTKEREEVIPKKDKDKESLKEKEDKEEKEALSETKSFPIETQKRTHSKKEKPVELFERLITENLYGLSDPLYDKLKEWCIYKTERKDEYTEIGLNTLIKKARRMSTEYGDLAICDVIDDSMASNYQGIVWDKLNNKRKSKKTLEEIWRDA